MAHLSQVLWVVVPGWTFISAVEKVLCWQLWAKSLQGRRTIPGDGGD